MADDHFRDIAWLRSVISHDPQTGKLHWKKRTLENSVDLRAMGIFNTQFAGKEAFCRLDRNGYFIGQVGGHKTHVAYFAHRLLWALEFGSWPDGEIDHINGSRTDNRISNLRCVTSLENARNLARPRNNTSGVIGVSFRKSANKWYAYIRVHETMISLGFFDEFQDAVRARKAAERAYGFHPNHGRAAA